jgi:hypothetical protein
VERILDTLVDAWMRVEVPAAAKTTRVATPGPDADRHAPEYVPLSCAY